jgi:glutamate-1-semialdehyde aminotransferase
MSTTASTSLISQQTAIAVMAKLKQANNFIDALHKQNNSLLKKLEQAVLDASNSASLELAKSLYLTALVQFRRKKTIGTAEFKTTHTDGSKYWSTELPVEDFYSDDGCWQVSVVRAGTTVRVHMTDKACADTKKDMDLFPCTYRNVKIHG